MDSRRAGLSVPLFSLRSRKSLGVGDFHDLKLCIQWAKLAGFKLLQILPVNDTSHSLSEQDGYPYSILSSFALHPIYLDLRALAPEEMKDEIVAVQQEVESSRFAYLKSYSLKLRLIQKLFRLRAEKDLTTAIFNDFFAENSSWLRPYAVFCFLRDRFRTSNFRKWKQCATFDPHLVEEISKTHFKSISLTYFTQFHLDAQFKEVKQLAEQEGILLKGDFPIGVHANSLEVWSYPHYFRFDKTIGAPPDFYNPLGQNWGFPSYDWERIKKDGFEWFKLRLKWFERYFHALRLDHLLGYFRLWEIPTAQVRGLMGIFFPSIPFTEEELKAAGLSDLKRFSEPLTPVAFDSEVKVSEKVNDLKKRNSLYTLIENRCFLREGNAYHPRIDVTSTQSFRHLPKKEQEIVQKLALHYFQERQESLWEEKGREKLSFMKSQTKLILCAEDIGMIPKCIEKVLKELKIPSLYVQRMPKDRSLEFEDPKDFPLFSVCMPSNHDTHPLRAFWEKDEGRRRRYAKELFGIKSPPKACTPEIAQAIVRAHMNSPSQWAIFLIQDVLAMDEGLRAKDGFSERINDPADPHYRWDWRLHLTLEELLDCHNFTRRLQEMIKEGKR